MKHIILFIALIFVAYIKFTQSTEVATAENAVSTEKHNNNCGYRPRCHGGYSGGCHGGYRPRCNGGYRRRCHGGYSGGYSKVKKSYKKKYYGTYRKPVCYKKSRRGRCY